MTRLKSLLTILLLIGFAQLPAQPGPPSKINFSLGFIHYRHVQGDDYHLTLVIENPDSTAPDSMQIWVDTPGGPVPDFKVMMPKTMSIPHPNGLKHHIYGSPVTMTNGNLWNISFKRPCCRPPMNNLTMADSSFTVSSILDLTSPDTNHTAMFDLPPITFARKDSNFYYNPNFYDREHDSLVYSTEALKNDMGPLGTAFASWTAPPGNFAVDAATGEITWNPPTIGAYGFTYKIQEFRNGNAIGTVNYDMMIRVDTIGGQNMIPDFTNTASWPVINSRFEFNAVVGDTLTIEANTQDGDGGTMSMEAGGENMSITNNTGVFSPVQIDDSTVNSTFEWSPAAADVRTEPYVVVFRGNEKNATSTSFIEVTVYITTSLTSAIDEKLLGNGDMKLWPNPTSQGFTLEFNLDQGEVLNMEILDAHGRVVHETQTRRFPKGKVVMMEASAKLSPGIYFVRINGERSHAVKPLVIQK